MNQDTATSPILRLVFLLPLISSHVLADEIRTNPALSPQRGDISTPLAPLYPTKEQQTGELWNTTEVMQCPDATQLSFEGQTPSCVALTPPTGRLP